ncbi:hypothetical protein ACFWUU_03495 [Kribbella sp. NPDC058693]|uniref:Secreted protein n=1 Tax=Kribbella jiaozuonensis TaxID=2575441 RepID=A0A4U3M6Q3_9ACTN|nr:hypothetical protein [Kribbella jiaozuonensis]TKK83116.1 hypothetical protein FDA38_10405 [Kribbella jiaozuonensis]
MRRSVRGAIAAGTSAVVLVGGLVGSTTIAAADPTPAPSPSTSYKQVTLSPEDSQKLCADRLPKMLERRDKLAQRIGGGADVKGSVAWLKARAAEQKTKGHTKVADRLEKRAERRSGRLQDLGAAKTKLEAFKAKYCQAAK